MKHYFRIAQKNICISAPEFICSDASLRLFECGECAPDIVIECPVTDVLPAPSLPYAGRGYDTEIFADEKSVQRLFRTGRDPAALSCFDARDTAQSKTYFTPNAFRLLMGGSYTFTSLSLVQLLLRTGVLFLHASFIEFNGRAILFSAPCGTGKSTQASLWEKYLGADVVNGDKAAVSLSDGVVYAHGVPFSGTSRICNDRSLPLAAIVLLSQAPEDTVLRLRGINAFRSVMSNVYLDLSDPAEGGFASVALTDILEKTPVYSFACTKEKTAVDTLLAHLVKEGDIAEK